MRTLLRPAVLLLLPLIGGCGSDDPVDPTSNGIRPYWSLQLNHKAITLGLNSEVDTLRLVATPFAPDGSTLDEIGVVTFTSSNTDVVTVEADGLLTGIGTTSGVMIVASMTAQGVTHADTATVAVTDDPGAIRLASFSIDPIPPDSAKFAVGGSYTESFRNLTPILLDTDGNPMEGLPVFFQSLDLTTALVDNWSSSVTGLRPGYLDIAARTTVYGEQFVDTLHYRIGYPGVIRPKMYGKMYAYITYPIGTFSPRVMRVGVGAVMELEYAMGGDGSLADVVFDNPAVVEAVPEQYSCVTYEIACEDAGNIEPFGPPAPLIDYMDYDRNRLRARRLTQAGTYNLSSATWGTTATIIVVDESEP
jgi:hypothetical protein